VGFEALHFAVVFIVGTSSIGEDEVLNGVATLPAPDAALVHFHSKVVCMIGESVGLQTAGVGRVETQGLSAMETEVVEREQVERTELVDLLGCELAEGFSVQVLEMSAYFVLIHVELIVYTIHTPSHSSYR
jgi:hypothetical protein